MSITSAEETSYMRGWQDCRRAHRAKRDGITLEVQCPYVAGSREEWCWHRGWVRYESVARDREADQALRSSAQHQGKGWARMGPGGRAPASDVSGDTEASAPTSGAE